MILSTNQRVVIKISVFQDTVQHKNKITMEIRVLHGLLPSQQFQIHAVPQKAVLVLKMEIKSGSADHSVLTDVVDCDFLKALIFQHTDQMVCQYFLCLQALRRRFRISHIHSPFE
jgi:hypothetical protein